MSQENVDRARAIYDEWAKGHLRVGREHLDPMVLFIPLRDYPAAPYYLGPEGIAEFIREWLKSWTNLTMTAEELIEAESSVVIAVRQRAVGRESGAPSEASYFEVWTFRGSAVIRVEQFAKREEALEAVGLAE